jgi:nucleotide-binding universal stress UspA family protein
MKLLIAYDGSSYSDVALEDLKWAGLSHDLEAVVLTVADVFALPEEDAIQLAASIQRARERAQRSIQEASFQAERARRRIESDFPNWKVSAQVRPGSPAWEIISKAEEWGADLITLGSRGLSGIQMLALGSVSQKVLAAASCSVRIARARRSRDDTIRLLIGFDGSPQAEAAAHQVATRAWPPGTKALVITIVEEGMIARIAHSLLNLARAQAQIASDEMALMRNLAEGIAERLRTTGLDASTLVAEGDPRRSLINEADRFGADVIFVGAIGLSGVKRFLLGGVASAVAARANCSVEVVRIG